MIDKFGKALLTMFGIGYFKYAPGTVSSFFVLFVWFFIPNIPVLQLYILFFHVLLGFYFCYLFSTKKNEDKDPGFIVIDEVVGMGISLFLLPHSLGLYFLAFLLFRIF